MTSKNGVQEELDDKIQIAAAIAGGMAARDRGGEAPLSGHDAVFIANMADLIYKAVWHQTMKEGEGGE